MTTHTHPHAITFRLGEDLMAAIERLQTRDGISPSEMIRRALTAWLATKGVLEASPSARAGRKRTTADGRR